MKKFNRMNFIIKGMDANVQPTFANDVTLAIYNAIKTDETKGQTYDLGGPHVYNYLDIYQHFFSLTEIKPYSVVVKLEEAMELYQHPWYVSPYRKLVRPWMCPE